MAIFLIFFLDVVNICAGLSESPTTTVSPMKSAMSFPLESEAPLFVIGENPTLTLKTIPFLAFTLEFGVMEMGASLHRLRRFYVAALPDCMTISRGDV